MSVLQLARTQFLKYFCVRVSAPKHTNEARQGSANNEFGEKIVKVSTKISTGNGTVGYAHLEIACTHHANVELSRIRGGVVKNGFFTVRK